MSIFKGSGVALVTPFKNGSIDYPALEQLISWHISEGTDAIISCGTTGEASTLSHSEKIDVVKFTLEKTAGKIPVIAGAGTNNTLASVDLAKAYCEIGVDGLLVVTPYYNKASRNGLIKHYEKIADTTDLPLILYSVKSRTGLNIEPDTVRYLSKHPNIVGIKEASSDISQIAEIASYIEKNKSDPSFSFDLYSGNDDQTIPIMSLGGIGCISTVANIIPAQYHTMTKLWLDGNLAEAVKMQLSMLPLIKSLFREVNPIPVKAALNIMGKIEREYRMPMCDPSSETLYLLYNEMVSYGIK
ncbi:MAG: 4-hydroxy-tetrahydrodipicolinate synthase [Eubacteriaceae bacterium]|nr:4-hydroxy-tetrahydrodipicolinate synthase [Eubacteriaceae bacterium]